MARYVKQRQEPKQSWWEAIPVQLPAPTVYEPDLIDTGILDADGHKIMRLPDPIGFVRKS